MKRNPEPVTVKPVEPVPQIKEDDLKDAIRNIIDTLPERHSARCNRAGCSICCVDVRTPIEKVAAKMGFPRATWPSDLEELMTQGGTGLSTDELLTMTPDELATIFDRATSQSVPLMAVGQEKITPQYWPGDKTVPSIVHNLFMSEEKRTVKRFRPQTPSERARVLQEESEKARRLEEAKRLLKHERKINLLKKQLADAMRVVV